MIKKILLPLFLLAGFTISCAHLNKTAPAHPQQVDSEKAITLNNAASLLNELLNNEKNVSKILIIKRNSDELGSLIKAISETSADNQRKLAALASNNPALNLHVLDLPPGEKAARDASAKTTEHLLLFSSGKEFEFNLLFCQAEALDYGGHLAKVAASHSSQPQEIKIFTSISENMENLFQQVIARIRQNP